MVVSRVGKEHDVGSQITRQVFSSPRSLAVVAGVLGVLGVDPGHAAPRLPAHRRRPRLRRLAAARSASSARAERAQAARRAPLEANAEASWDDLQPVDTLGLEVGYRLIALVDKARQGDLLARIKGVRAQVRAGRRLPAAAGAHPRQPRAEAERLPPDAARRGRRRRRGLSRACGWRSTRAARRTPLLGTRDHRPGVRPARDVDRGAPARDGADGRIYGR